MKCINVAFAVLLSCSLPLAQTGTASKVLIPIIVTDSHQRPVGGLTSSSLVIREHKTLIAEVGLLRGVDLPLELGVVIDTSNSERGSGLGDILSAAKDFINRAIGRPEDRIFFLTFGTTSETTPRLTKEQIAGLSLNLKISGQTALYDSVALACSERMGPRDWKKPTRRVLVVISDGEDTLSHITRLQATSDTLKSGVVLFTVSTRDSGSPSRGDRIMENWAERTGGKFFLGGYDAQKSFGKILELMNAMYYASYAPPSSTHNVHEIDVRSAPHENFDISYPREYVWP